MKKIIMSALLLSMPFLEANVSLDNLVRSNKAECFEKLKTTSDEELWSIFLKGQTNLFFPREFQWIEKGKWWKEAKDVLELGSGDGSYLNKLSQKFPHIHFKGVELVEKYVKSATANYSHDQLIYEQGDAQVYNKDLENSFDIVLLRLTLQHLKDPVATLNHVQKYLRDGGHVVIIESFDQNKATSHPCKEIDVALQLAAEIQKGKGKGNRKVSFDFFKEIKENSSSLSQLYDVQYSNLDLKGHLVGDNVRFESEKEGPLYFNHAVLFSELVHRTYQIPLNLDQAYDELQVYLTNKDAWACPGVHFLVLKKKI